MYTISRPYGIAHSRGAFPSGVSRQRARSLSGAPLGAVPSAKPEKALIGQPAPYRLRPFSGAEDTLRSMSRAALGDRGEKSFRVRQFAEWIVRDIEPKDYLGEIVAVRNVFVQRSPMRKGSALFRYTNDPLHVELVKDPERLVEEVELHGSTLADCDEIVCLAGTCCLQLGREVEWIALGFGGGDQYTHVGLRVKEPKSGRWIWLDGVAGPREREAAMRATKVMPWSLA